MHSTRLALLAAALTGALAAAPALAKAAPAAAYHARRGRRLAKAAPQQLALGQVAGIAVDRRRSHLDHAAAGDLLDDEKAAQQNPPETKCCAAAPPVLEFDPSGNLLRPGAARPRLRLAQERARHPHRPRRQRLARRQRQDGRPDPEVHPGRQVPACRSASTTAQGGSNSTDAARPPGAHDDRCRRPTRSMSPTATATGA